VWVCSASQGDYFGELAVLCQERPGVQLKRTRSAFACASRAFALLYALTYSDMQELRLTHPQVRNILRIAE
jgi:CRP-like cAMP-binding protein